MERDELERRWLSLTRDVLPARAGSDWPVRFDHCFQRICLDHATGGVWYDHISGRPAYRAADTAVLARATALAEAIADGDANLDRLNAQSIAWRRARKGKPSA